jgi:flagellar hook-length control protein FliK
MAVAALSNAALALTGSVAPQPSGPAPAAGSAPESAQNFAKLVSRQSDQKTTPDGEHAQPDSKLPADAPTASPEDAAASTEGDATADAETGDKPETLLADIEAMVAAAAQLGNGQPVLPVITISSAPTPVADSAGGETALPTVAAILAAGASLPSQTPSADGAAPKGAAATVPAFATALSTASGQNAQAQTVTTGEPVASDPALTTGGDAAPSATVAAAPTTTTGEPRQATPELTHIASLIASLRQAFAPAGTAQTAEPLRSDGAAAPIAIDPQSAATVASEQAEAAIPTVLRAPVVTSGGDDASESETSEAPAVGGEAVTAPTLPLPSSAKTPVAPVVTPKLSNEERSTDEVSTPVTTGDDRISGLDGADPSVAAEALPKAPELPPVDTGETQSTAATVPTPAAPAPSPAPATATDTGMQVGDAGVTDGNSVQQQTIDRHLDLARDTQWLDRLARDISRAADHQGHLKFQLNPEHLGALTVEIVNSAAGTAIRMSTDTDQARQIIADAQPRLLAEVRAQGLRVAESHVDLNNQQSGGGTGSTGAQAQQGQQGQSRQPSEDNKPFSPNQSAVRDEAVDSTERDDRDLYA